MELVNKPVEMTLFGEQSNGGAQEHEAFHAVLHFQRRLTRKPRRSSIRRSMCSTATSSIRLLLRRPLPPPRSAPQRARPRKRTDRIHPSTIAASASSLSARSSSESASLPWIETREAGVRQNLPGPLARREIPANVAVAEFLLLQGYAKPVAEDMQIGGSARKSCMDNLNRVDRHLFLQVLQCIVTGAAEEVRNSARMATVLPSRLAGARARPTQRKVPSMTVLPD
jgi:hypothetical protein